MRKIAQITTRKIAQIDDRIDLEQISDEDVLNTDVDKFQQGNPEDKAVMLAQPEVLEFITKLNGGDSSYEGIRSSVISILNNINVDNDIPREKINAAASNFAFWAATKV